MIKEDLARQLRENEEICKRQELEILSLKEDLGKTSNELKTRSKFEKGTMIMNDILSKQRSPHEKSGLRGAFNLPKQFPTPSRFTVNYIFTKPIIASFGGICPLWIQAPDEFIL